MSSFAPRDGRGHLPGMHADMEGVEHSRDPESLQGENRRKGGEVRYAQRPVLADRAGREMLCDQPIEFGVMPEEHVQRVAETATTCVPYRPLRAVEHEPW